MLLWPPLQLNTLLLKDEESIVFTVFILHIKPSVLERLDNENLVQTQLGESRYYRR